MDIISWILANKLELFGTISALLYLYFSIKQNILLWPLGILASAIYIAVYFQSKFYADMGLQVYYLLISIYGWYYWVNGKAKIKEAVEVRNVGKNELFILLSIGIILFFILAWGLSFFTDSDVPYGDAFTTAFSVVATWMLAKKILEQWIFWIVIDAIAMGLYIYKGLYITAILFLIYTIMAVYGYLAWKKEQTKSGVQALVI